MNPHDPEAEVTKMKNGTTHLAYKAEQAVDLETGAIVAITTLGGATGDTTSVQETLPAVGVAVAEQIATPTVQGEYKVHEQEMGEVVMDKSQGASGKANRSSKPRCTPTGGVWKARVGRVYCAGAASLWSGPSRISMKQAQCGGWTCAAEATSPSECCCRRRLSIWR